MKLREEGEGGGRREHSQILRRIRKGAALIDRETERDRERERKRKGDDGKTNRRQKKT